MSEPARHYPSHESPVRSPSASAPLRDWLQALRATAPEQPAAVQTREPVEPARPEPKQPQAWAPRVVASQKAAPDEDIADIVAENMMLKAKLRLEAERRDELQLLLAQEIRELRAHIEEEISRIEDLREERDLWKARCEALMQPLFRTETR